MSGIVKIYGFPLCTKEKVLVLALWGIPQVSQGRGVTC